MIRLNTLKQITLEAGELLLDLYENTPKVSYKAGHQLVTDADIIIQKYLLERLEKYNYGIVAEERTIQTHKKLTWVIDPIDGTKRFINKTGDFAIMIALLRNRVLVMSTVYQPTKKKLYFAKRDAGCFLKIGSAPAKQIHVSSRKGKSRIAIIGKDIDPTSPIIKPYRQKLGLTRFLNSGGAGVKAGLLAEGKGDIYIIPPGNKGGEWDAAAPQLLVTEAGGSVTDVFGKPLQYNKKKPNLPHGFIMSNRQTNTDIITALRK